MNFIAHPYEKESICITKEQFLKELAKLPYDRTMTRAYAGEPAEFSNWWNKAEQGEGIYIVTFTEKMKDVPNLSYIKCGMEIIFFKGMYRFQSVLKQR